MEIINQITIYELIVPYLSSTIIFMTVCLYIYMDNKVPNKRYRAMRNVLFSMFLFNIGYLFQVQFVLYGYMQAAGNAYAISQMGMTFFVPFGITYLHMLVDMPNSKLKYVQKTIARVLYILGFVSIPLSFLAANLDFSILHWGTKELSTNFHTNLARQALPEIYFSIRNVLYLFISIGMVVSNCYYCFKNREGIAPYVLSLAFFTPLIASLLDVFVNMGRPLFFSVEAHFSRNTVGMALFAMIAFISSISMFVAEHFKVDILRNKLAIVNIQNDSTIEQVEVSKDLFLKMQNKLSDFVRNLNVNSKSIHSSCQFSIFYTNSLLEANQYFSDLDDAERNLYDESRKKIDRLYSSFEVLKKAVSGQASTLDSIVNEISDSSDILINVEGRIEHLNKMSNDLVGSYSKVKQSMLDSFKSLDTIVETTGAVKKSIIFIKDISEKTNLLSINANIQASKSSQWDSSFGFVATEIADLALDSHTAAERIDELFLMVTKTTNEFIFTKNYIIDVFDSIIDNISSTMQRIKHISNIVSSQISDNKTIKQNTQFAKELNNSISFEIEARYDEIYEVIQRFDALDQQFEFFREQLILQTNEINKLAKDMDELIDLSKELNGVSQNITAEIEIIEEEIKGLPTS